MKLLKNLLYTVIHHLKQLNTIDGKRHLYSIDSIRFSLGNKQFYLIVKISGKSIFQEYSVDAIVNDADMTLNFSEADRSIIYKLNQLSHIMTEQAHLIGRYQLQEQTLQAINKCQKQTLVTLFNSVTNQSVTGIAHQLAKRKDFVAQMEPYDAMILGFIAAMDQTQKQINS
ncbi:MAG: hypothetical protein Tsb005_14970 [Gammaproteobacteria bacterium]